MPHTALASWFRESYKEAVAAQSAGGEEWHWRAPHPLASRPSRPAASAPQSEEDPVPGIAAPSAAPRIAIVGAGLAGLTCAYRLKQAGFAATIFEADHRRISGRCDSRRGAFEAGQVIERGGMLIDTGHHALRRLIDELGLKTTDLIASELAGTEPFYYFDGQPYTLAEAAADFKQVIPKLKADVQQAGFPATYSEYTPRALELDQMSVVDWIEESIPGGMNSKLGRLIDIACNIEYGAESEEQSALNFIYLHEQVGEDDKFSIFGISDERYQVKGGNDQIVHRLVDRLAPGNIRRGNRLIAIAEQLNGTYQLSFQDRGGTYVIEVDEVVLTLPFSILRSSVDYSGAGFRPLKTAAIEELGMGANSKLHLQFKERYWARLGNNGDTIADTGYQNTFDVTRGQLGDQGILVQYTGGHIAEGANLGSPIERAHRFLQQLEPLLPGITAQWNGKATRDYWVHNPFSLGSYSYRKIGQFTKFAGIEGESEGVQGNCHFAGEHTSVVYQGYMNGAVESGEQAAERIIKGASRSS